MTAPGIVEMVNINVATVTWEAPAQPNGIIIAYVVISYIYEGENGNSSDMLDPNDRTYMIPNLSKQQCVVRYCRQQTLHCLNGSLNKFLNQECTGKGGARLVFKFASFMKSVCVRGMIWTIFDWLSKFYIAAVIGIICIYSIRIKTCHKN